VLNALSQIISAVVNGTSGIYNVGGNSKLTIRELAQTVCDLTDSKLIVPVSETAFLKDAPKHVELDLTKVLELPGQIPFIGIEDGLQRTIQSMRSN
jgi:nucleoside-diphosphate-sugar epimerase